MLEQIVQKFRGIILLFIVFSLSAVFLLQFGGPQGEGCSKQTVGAAAEVYGQVISRGELQAAFTLFGGDNYPDELAQQYRLEANVLDGLIERSLLAREARRLGFAQTDEEVLQRVAEDGTIHMSMAVDAGPNLPPSGAQRFSFEDSKGKFSKDNLKNFIQYQLRRSVAEFARSQIEETLADRMRQTIASGVTVGAGEVWNAYVREKESVTLQYVRFSNVYYAQQLEPSEQELSAFLAAEKKAIDAEYESQKQRYTGLEKQVRARHILIKAEESASAEAKQAARANIDGLLARVKKGEDFASLAQRYSQDEGSAKKSGDLGYNPQGRMVKPFDDAQFALAPGQISEVVESTFGYHVIKVEAVREGDVPIAEAKREIAEKLLREKRAAERTKQAAFALQAKLEQGMTLDDALLAMNPDSAKPAGEEAPVKDPLAPEVRETRPFGRTDTAIPGPFDSLPLVKAAYALTLEDPLPKEPMRLGDDLFVYRLESKVLAERKEFKAEDKERIERGLLRRKQTDVLKAYVHTLRDRAAKDDALYVDQQFLATAKSVPPKS